MPELCPSWARRQDLVDNLEKVESIHPAAHRVKVPGAALYLERSPIAKKYRDLPVGSTVFPVKSQGGWVEVVVVWRAWLPHGRSCKTTGHRYRIAWGLPMGL